MGFFLFVVKLDCFTKQTKKIYRDNGVSLSLSTVVLNMFPVPKEHEGWESLNVELLGLSWINCGVILGQAQALVLQCVREIK